MVVSRSGLSEDFLRTARSLWGHLCGCLSFRLCNWSLCSFSLTWPLGLPGLCLLLGCQGQRPWAITILLCIFLFDIMSLESLDAVLMPFYSIWLHERYHHFKKILQVFCLFFMTMWKEVLTKIEEVDEFIFSSGKVLGRRGTLLNILPCAAMLSLAAGMAPNMLAGDTDKEGKHTGEFIYRSSRNAGDKW